MRPFRFGVNLFATGIRADWQAKARQVEDLGYDALAVPDHLGFPAPFPALVTAAEVTSRVTLGTFVLNTGFSRPALLAREVATTQQLTGGRLELGLGTGYVPAEFAAADLPFPGAGARIDHLADTTRRLRTLLPAEVAAPPVLIAGHGDRVLRLAATEADIVGFSGARPGQEPGSLRLVNADVLAERVAFVRAAAGDRLPDLEFNVLVQAVSLSTDSAETEALLARYAHQDSTVAELARVPMLLHGGPERIAEQLHRYREELGISYVTVLEPAMTDFARVIQQMR